MGKERAGREGGAGRGGERGGARREPDRRELDRRELDRRDRPVRRGAQGVGKPVMLDEGVRVVHEDEHVIVIEKPSGLLTASLEDPTLPSAFTSVKLHVRDKVRKRGTRVWIIHRLDKEASGLLVFAKTPTAFERLKEQLRTKDMHRGYAAVVEGEFPVVAGSRQAPMGTVQNFLMEDSEGVVHIVDAPGAHEREQRGRGDRRENRGENRQEHRREDRRGDRGGRQGDFRGDSQEDRGREQQAEESRDHPKLAITHYRVLRMAHGRSLVLVRLETGRKHQIRVHMKHLGHPIVGDRRYGAKTDHVGRVCLHATELGFVHPGTGKAVRYRSDAPSAFAHLLGGEREGDFADASGGEIGAASSGATNSRGEEEPVAREAGGASAVEKPKRGDKKSAPPSAQGSWDHVANWYQSLMEERRSDHHDSVLLPGVFALLGDVRGKRVLDVACGQGSFCRAMRERGASCVGVDASAQLIAHAKKLDPLGSYEVGDARDLEGSLAGGGDTSTASFDVVTCIMALMNIDPLDGVLRGAAAMLKPGGMFVGVMLHPAFRSPGATSWGWAEGEREEGPPAVRDRGEEGAEFGERGFGERGFGERGFGQDRFGAVRGGYPQRGGYASRTSYPTRSGGPGHFGGAMRGSHGGGHGGGFGGGPWGDRRAMPIGAGRGDAGEGAPAQPVPVTQYRRVDAYLGARSKEIVMNPGAASRGEPAITTTTHHRAIGAYVRACVEAGLLISALEEWASTRVSEPGPRAAEENRARREIPMFLAVRAVKARG